MNPWRERMDRWLGPLARWCPLSPNSVTVLALLFSLAAAGLLMAARQAPALFLWAIPLLIVGGVLDLLDGMVARLKNRQSPFGDFLDHFLDRVSDVCLTAGWVIGSGARIQIALAAVVAVMLDGYIGTQTEASFRTRSYEATGRAEFILAMVSFPLIGYILASAQIAGSRWGGATAGEWLTLLMAAFAVVGIVQRLREARRFAGRLDNQE